MPETIFSQRQQQFTQAEQLAQQQHNQLAFWRLIWFLGSVIAVWLFIRFDLQMVAVLTFLVGIIGFLVLLKKHQQVKRQRDLNHWLAFINQDEVARLKRQYVRPETGEQYSSPTHSYTGDLDVFGQHSLFRLLNRTHTYEGQNRLASWLKTPAMPPLIRLRQEAVADLAPQLNWRQEVEALAYLEETVNRSPDALITWATADVQPVPAYLNTIRFLFPAVTLGLFIAWLMGLLPGSGVLFGLAIHGLMLSRTSARAKEISEQTVEISTALRAFRSIVQQAQQVEGTAKHIEAIRQTLSAGEHSAADAMGKLSSLTEGLNYRRNPYFYLLFGVITLWDIHYLIRLERWRMQYGGMLSQWLDALAELEALSSLAGFAYAHPNYVVPTISDEQLLLEFGQLAHPLLAPDRSVGNSLSLKGVGQTILITGSNMSGKSTFLRTVGANVILALAGSVVPAESFQCSPVRVFTSMRTQDSLEESTSSFYAELKRLQTLIGLTKDSIGATLAESSPYSSLPVLYFLDEILKGTNSADRHRGAEALIRQLHQTIASGFVSTHDLELGQLTDADEFVRNFHFQSDLRNGELVFDYKIREGICESFNASQLMQAIGIDMGLNQK